MPIGTVKWFNNAKGYGFILPDEDGEDLFVHYSSIQMEGYKTLKAGQQVAFDIVEGDKGLHATNIQMPENASSDSGPPPLAVSESDAAEPGVTEPETSEEAVGGGTLEVAS